MASRDLSIRLSVKDADQVKVALAKLGVDGQQAIDLIGKSADRTNVALNKQEKELQQLRNQLDPTARAATQFAKAQDTINSALLRGSISSSQASALNTAALARQEAILGKSATTAGVASTAFGGFTKVLGTFGIALSAVTLVQFGKHVLEAGSRLDELSEQLGISANGIQAYSFAAVQGGVKIELMEKTLAKFTQSVAKADEGDKKLAERFKQLGVAIYDATGKLRPIDDLLTETARAILKIEDPTKRAIAMTDLFSKSGQRLLPILADIAKGQKSLYEEANKAGAVITPETIKRLDQFADALERWKLMGTAQGAEIFAVILKGADLVAQKFEETIKGIDSVIVRGSDVIVAGFAGIIAAVNNVFSTFPQMIKNWFITAINGAIQVLQDGLNFISKKLSETDLGRKLGITNPAPIQIPRVGSAFEDYDTPAADPGSAFSNEFQRTLLARQTARARELAARGRLGASSMSTPDVITPGSGYATPKGGGGGDKIEDRRAKLIADAELQLEYAKKIAEAAKIGADAVQQQEIAYKAAKQAQDAYGKSAGANAEAVNKLKNQLIDLNTQIAVQKELKDLRLGTEEINRQNDLISAQIRLLDAPPIQRARELALLTEINRLAKLGIDYYGQENAALREAVDLRVAAVTKQAELNEKLVESKKSAADFAKPFEQAITGIQNLFTDTFEGIFNKNITSWKDFAGSIKSIWHRLMAELATMTIIRPIISFITQGLSGAGLVPQSVATQFGGAGGGVGGGGLLGGGGIPGLGGGGGDMFGISGFMSRNIFGGSNPIFGAASGLDAAGNTLGGVGSVGGVLGGLGGIGMGIMGLAQGNIAGGISGLLGGGLGLLGGMGVLGSWAGPAGMAIGLIGSLLGGMLKKKPKAPQAVSNLMFQDGGWLSSLAMTRGKGNLGTGTGKAADTIGRALDDIAGEYGFNFTEGTQGGWIGHSIGKKTGSQFFGGLGQYGGARGVGFGATTLIQGAQSAEEVANVVASAIIKAAAKGGTISGLSASGITALSHADLASIEDVKAALDFAKVFDKFGRDITDAQKAVEAINEEFKAFSKQAEKYGLDTGRVEAERQKVIGKMATDVNDAVRRAQLSMTSEGSLQVSLEDIDKAHEIAIKNALYINTVSSILIDINAMEAQYGRERLQLIEDFNEAATSSIKDLWNRLTFGDLSGASPVNTLTGTEGAFKAALAQAQTGSITAKESLAGLAQDWISSSLQFSGNDPRTEAIRQYIRNAIAPFVTANENMSPSSANGNDIVLQQQQQIIALTGLVNTLTDQVSLLVQRLSPQ